MSVATPEPGIHADVPMDEYHRWPGASKSRLWLMRERSPAHVRWAMDHPPESTPAQAYGTAAHMAILEPSRFAEVYERLPDGDGRTKAVKDARAAIEEDGRIPLKPDDFDAIMAMRDVVLDHPKARRLLEGDAERSLVWTDPDTGVLCKGRADLLSDRGPVIVDYKTTRDASPEAFERAIYIYGYYVQGAMYLDGASALGDSRDHFVIIAQEKGPPFCVGVYDLRPDALLKGADEYGSLLRQWARCVESGEWPGYGDRVVPIGIPEWAARKIEERLEIGGEE